jgi:hypothetical protein
VATANALLKQASQMSEALKPGQSSPFGKLTPEMAAVGVPPDPKNYPLGINDPTFRKDVQQYGQAVSDLKQSNAMALARARGESSAYGRAKYMQVPVLDQDTQSPSFKSPLEIAQNPTSYVPLNEGDKLMMKNAVFEDIKGAAGNLRTAITNNKEGFTASQVAQMNAAMRDDPTGGLLKSTIDQLTKAGVKDHMTDAQQAQAVAMQQAYENAYALRSVAGFGSGSDQLRAAIKATLPSASSPPGYAMKQLTAFEQQVDRLGRGVANVKLKPPAASAPQAVDTLIDRYGGQKPAGGTQP